LKSALLLLGLALLATAAPAQPSKPTPVTLGVVTLAGDPRHAPRRMEKAYPGHPAGKALGGVALGVDDAQVELDTRGIALQVKAFELADAASLNKLLADLKAARVQHVVADLPVPELRALVQAAPAALGGALVFNTAQEDDALRAEHCAMHLLHTAPSAAMRADALAQYLAARSWRKALLLTGPTPDDAALARAFERAAKRYGVQIVERKPFKLTGDPRERELANTRLLTNERSHEVVAVMDADGEFARTLPYATQWPRPVVGASGLTAQAWHPHWERYGGPQLTRRFARANQRPMGSHDWAAWAAAKAVAAVLVHDPKATIAQQAQALRNGTVAIDGFKGQRLTFRAWDGQLRQPLFLAHGDGVVGSAPLDGVLHPKEVLDTLGVDQAESACKAR